MTPREVSTKYMTWLLGEAGISLNCTMKVPVRAHFPIVPGFLRHRAGGFYS